jgi:hypothetical protein
MDGAADTEYYYLFIFSFWWVADSYEEQNCQEDEQVKKKR